MYRTTKALGFLLMVSLCATTAAFGAIDGSDSPNITITPHLGAGLWSDDLDLNNSLVWGIHGGLQLTRHLALESTINGTGSEREGDGLGVDMAQLSLGLLADMLPSSRYSPFVTAKFAHVNYNTDGPNNGFEFRAGEFGIGVKARLCGDDVNHRALRVELRDVVTKLTPAFANDDEYTHNLIASVGLHFAFGRSNRDTDGDGVLDRHDACKATPAGARVDAKGCPTDSDGDGVYDGLDDCSRTPVGALVDEHGCPTDSDSDGVYDGLDACSNTPQGARVDATGCVTDADRDGVPDGLDHCDSTPDGAVIDVHGCPIDSDGDGVPDGLDTCPDTPSNLLVDNYGCPMAVTETETQLLNTGQITSSRIAFASGSATIDEAHSEDLIEIGETLSNWPELEMEISGHTDSTGAADLNQRLSQARAQAVLDYLISHYPNLNADNYTVVGKGEIDPIADNTTVEGRRANRRVEFTVLNPEALKREIEHRRMIER